MSFGITFKGEKMHFQCLFSYAFTYTCNYNIMCRYSKYYWHQVSWCHSDPINYTIKGAGSSFVCYLISLKFWFFHHIILSHFSVLDKISFS